MGEDDKPSEGTGSPKSEPLPQPDPALSVQVQNADDFTPAEGTIRLVENDD